MGYLGTKPANSPLTSELIPDGIIATSDLASLAVTPEKMSQKLTMGTAVASTSGTSIDFTGIPSWAKKVTVMLSGVSTNGSSQVQIQLGDSGGIETTGYLGSVDSIATTGTAATFTTGLALERSAGASASNVRNGSAVFTFLGSNNWSAMAMIGLSNGGQLSYSACSKTLSDSLTQVRITTVNGTDAFDAGSINIMYEG